MRKSEIKIGGEYAVKVPGKYRGDKSRIVRATVVRPNERFWIVTFVASYARSGRTQGADRTHSVTSQAIVAKWTDYCRETAHAEAIEEDNQRRWQAEYEAEKAAVREHRRPIVDVFRGIEVAGEAFVSSNVELPMRDLGEWLDETFIDGYAVGSTVRFDVFERIAARLLTLEAQLLDSAGGWTRDSARDTGVPVVVRSTEKPNEGE